MEMLPVSNYGSKNWKTICWKIKDGITCDPSDESARYTLGHCPSEEDCNNMPTRKSVIKAPSYDTFAKGLITNIQHKHLKGFQKQHDSNM